MIEKGGGGLYVCPRHILSALDILYFTLKNVKITEWDNITVFLYA